MKEGHSNNSLLSCYLTPQLCYDLQQLLLPKIYLPKGSFILSTRHHWYKTLSAKTLEGGGSVSS